MTIKLSSKNLNKDSIRDLNEISNTNLFSCYQCGNCSAGCPCIDEMEIPPNQIIRLIQLGEIEKALKSNTMWICAACLTCSVRCPREVDITSVMEALRQIHLRDKLKMNYIDINKIDEKTFEELPQIALINSFRKLTS